MSPRDVPVGGRGVRVSVVLLALLCLGTGVLVGWQLRGAPGRPPSYLAQLTDTLDLRPDQVAALESVLAEEDRQIDELLHGKLQQLNEPVSARRAQTEAALVALLDPSQRARYEQLLRAEGDDGESGR